MRFLSSWFDRGSEILFQLLVLFLPVVFIPTLWATLPHAKMSLIALCAGVGIALYAGARFLDGTIALPKSWILCSGVLLLFVYAVSASWVGGGRTSFIGAGIEPDTVATIFLWTAVLFLAALIFKTRPQLVRLGQLIVAGAGLVALFQLARLVFGAGALTFGGIFTDPSASVIGSWHDLAIFLGLAAFLATALLSAAPGYAGRAFIWFSRTIAVAAVALLVVINMTDVWVGLMTLATLSLIALFFYDRGNPSGFAFKQFVAKALPLAILLALALVFSLYGRAIHDRLPDRIRIEHVEVRPSWEGTFSVAAHMSGTGSLLGSGPNTFVRQWGLYKPSGVNETAFWNADFSQGVGLIPTALITVGIIGILAWIFFLITVLYEGVRIVIKSPRDVRFVIGSLALAAAYLWAFAFIYHPGISLVACAFLLTGALVGWGAHTGALSVYAVIMREARMKGFIVSVLLAAITFLSLGVSFLVLRTVFSDMLVNRGIAIYNASSDIAAAQSSVDQALRLDQNNERANRAALELGILQAAALANSEEPDADRLREQLTETISTAIQHGLAAVSIDSADYQNYIALARVYEQLIGAQVEGAYENAQQAYERAIDQNPTNPLFHLRLAQLAVARNDLDRAERYLVQAIQLKPNFAAALFLASQVAAAKGDYEGALITASGTVQAAPEEPVAWFQLGTLLYQGDRHDEARAALEQAVSLNANYANAIYVLGLAYAALDRPQDALRAMQRVLELNPGNEQVLAVIAGLEKQAADAE